MPIHNKNLAYRPEIDGLRAFAVVPVVLFHAGFSTFKGGFVGVDIFFVISGYLITSIIHRELSETRFSIARFYERRARRILPALIAMLLVTLVLLVFIGLPAHLEGGGKSALAALLSVSNIYFWTQSGYFAPASEFEPFLHTWSLGVEEQFYILFPPALMLLAALRWRRGAVMLAALPILFAVGLYLSVEKPSVAFYLLPARAWELALGAVLAFGILPAIAKGALSELLAALGLGLVLFAIFWIDSSMPFPGWVALIPCIGTALVIHASPGARVVPRLLSLSPIVFVGLVSYSFYLWHWPIFVLLRMEFATAHLPTTLGVIGSLAAFALAVLSWRYVERPFRRRETMPVRRMGLLLGTAAAVTLAVSVTWTFTGGLPQRLNSEAKGNLAAADDVDPMRERCRESVDFALFEADCAFGSTLKQRRAVLIGDSHAAALRPALAHVAEAGSIGMQITWRGACPPLEGIWRVGDSKAEDCAKYLDAVLSAIEADPQIETVILGGRWGSLWFGRRQETGGAFREDLQDVRSEVVSPAETHAVFLRGLKRSVNRLQAAEKRVVIVGPVPEHGFDVPRMTALASFNGRDKPAGIPEIGAEYVELEAALAGFATSEPEVTYISLHHLFCDASENCPSSRGGRPIYSDDDHITATTARELVGPWIAPKLLPLLSNASPS